MQLGGAGALRTTPKLGRESWRFDPLGVQSQSHPLAGLHSPLPMTQERCLNFSFLPLVLFPDAGVKDGSPEMYDEIDLGMGGGTGNE